MKIIRSIGSIEHTEGRTIQGVAIVTNQISNDLGGFREIILPEALNQELIDRSDIIANMNHDNGYMMARCKNGKGNLSLEITERGLEFSFDVAETAKGEELLQHVKRGEMDSCSFCFTLPQDHEGYRWKGNKKDGYIREIFEFDRLWDVSVVSTPAYPQTSCSARDLEDLETYKRSIEEIKEEEIEVRSDEDVKEEEKPVEEKPQEEPQPEEKPTEEENPVEEEKEESRNEEINKEEEQNKRSQEKNNTKIKMNTKFSFINAINAIANNRSLDSVEAAVVAKGAEEMRNVGLSYGGQIQLPVSELRADITVAAEGEDIVATDIYDVMLPLRSENVLAQAGAKFLTGLKGDIQVPVMSPTSVFWETENGEAKDGGNTFDSVTLSPKRLTAYVNISKQLLIQNSEDVENLIRTDLVKAINSKLESTILGNGAGDAKTPAGIFNGATPTAVTGLADIADVESDVEDANFNVANAKWVVSRKFKAALRSMAKGENIAESLFVGGEIDGTPALSTGNVPAKQACYGDWSQLAIGQWGSIDVTVDPYTRAKFAEIVLVVNCYFDAKVLRDGAFAFAKVD